MAYDRYDRDERSRWSDNRSDQGWRGDNRSQNYRGPRDERGFWDRASDEVASWFGDEEAERRRRQDQMREEREYAHTGHSGERSAFGRGWGTSTDRDYDRGYGRDFQRDESAYGGYRSDRDFNEDRRRFSGADRNWSGPGGSARRSGFSDRDYNPNWRRDLWGARDWQDSRDWDRNRGYRPMTGDYGRGSEHESDQFYAASGYGRDYDRSQTPYGTDETRRTSFAGSRNREFDPHYRSWRERHMSDLDRDYDDYRHENQSRFENDFTSWRERRQHKRGLLGQIREHMEVVGNDDKHVGTVDCTRGDRLILTKSDPESGGAHHSLSCNDIDRIEGDRVILDCSADEAHARWRDESRDRALFEREDQGEMGPRNLNRSFEGTYR
jgi:hypothetical protein